MSRSEGARLYLVKNQKDKRGNVKPAHWIIRDGSHFKRTGCLEKDRAGAEGKLQEYLVSKYQPERQRSRHPSEILILDVLKIYQDDIAPKHARPAETDQRILKLSEFWKERHLIDVNGKRCREYVQWRIANPTPHPKTKQLMYASKAAARRELEDLRAAINHHRQEGLCSEIISVALPEKSVGRDVFLTEKQAAALVRAAWRARQIMRDGVTKRSVGKHLARFILVGLRTGTRHKAITGAALRPTIGRGYVDLESGVFHRRARGAKETSKRQPPVKLPAKLLAHIRRWHRLGIANDAVIEWNGQSVKSVRKAFASAVKAAGLPISGPDKVTPHTLRHTAATWLMQRGVNVWEAAGYLGMTVEMLEQRYGHHHPDFQKNAANKLSRGAQVVHK